MQYQPTLAIHERRFVGLEALARWQHPGGLIGLGKVIPLIERTRAIDWFNRRSLAEAIRQIAKWRIGGSVPSVAVNLSTRNLLNTPLRHYVQGLLSERRVPPSLPGVGDIRASFGGSGRSPTWTCCGICSTQRRRPFHKRGFAPPDIFQRPFVGKANPNSRLPLAQESTEPI